MVKDSLILQGNVMWSYEHEIMELSLSQKYLVGSLSFAGPIHHHTGNIILTETGIVIEGDHGIAISLASISQVYLGYDDVYTASSVKNMGLLWQPLRVTFYSGSRSETVYLIVDYQLGIYTHDKRWYETLVNMLG